MKTPQQAAEDIVSELKARYLHDEIQDIDDLGVQCFLAGYSVAMEQKWISVEDRLPEKSQRVFIPGGIGYMAFPGVWYTITATEYPQLVQWEVTHWMHLPSPPSQKENNLKTK